MNEVNELGNILESLSEAPKALPTYEVEHWRVTGGITGRGITYLFVVSEERGTHKMYELATNTFM